MNHLLLKYAFILLLILSINQLISQESLDHLTIGKLEFKGLKKTKFSYLEKLINTQLGGTTTEDQLKKDVQHLVNLNAIAGASYQVDTLNGELALTFNIQEALTAFPIINFGGIRGNFWFQLGFTDINWLGKGIQLSASYQNNDGRNNYSFYYRVPYISGSRWGTAFSFLQWASVEPVFFDEATVFYDYTNTSVGLNSIYQIGRNHSIEFGGSYFVEDYQKNSRHLEEVTPGPQSQQQKKVLAKIIHQFARIDYDYYILDGFDNVVNTQAVYSIADKNTFFILMNDTRFFKKVGYGGNIAARLRVGISTNDNSPFAPFVLDSHVNIRGSGNRIDRGTAAFILNLEYRHRIFDRGRFAGQVVAFADSGTWRNPGGSFSDLLNRDNFRQFVGGGIRLIYKKAFNSVFRLDYGFDLHNFQQRGVVVGLGQYF